MSKPKAYGSITEEIEKASGSLVWTEETVECILAATLNGGLQAIADAHNSVLSKQAATIEKLKHQIHVYQVCDEIFLERIKPIRHLWDEFNQPPGIGMICDKIAEQAETIEELQQWKESALSVMPNFQAIGKEIGAPLGSSVTEQILPWIKKQADQLEIAWGVIANAGGGAVPVIAVPYMGEVGRKLCTESGTSWFDLSGNANIVAPGLRILIDGKPNRFTRRGRPSTSFAPRSSRVARRLLLQPERSFRQQEIARATGLNDGSISRIVHRLEEDGLVERDEDGRVRVRDPNLLFEAWSEAYRFDKHTITRGHVTARSGDELLARLAKTLAEHRLRYAATGLAAAWLYTAFAGFRLVTVFVEKMPAASVIREIGFRDEPKGANVWLVVPNDGGVFEGADRKDGIVCVHPMQAYLDLGAQPERAKEAAAELRSRCLR